MENQINSVLDLIDFGGPVIIILLLLSMVVVTVAIFKAIQFSMMRMWNFRAIDRLVSDYLSGNEDVDLKQIGKTPNPVGQILLLADELKGRFKGDEGLITEELSCFASEKIENMRGGLRPVEFIGMVSPLLGLLGTVLGMIEAFRQLQMGGAQVDPSILSGGIWVALLTTAVGLGVAIPAVALHNFFESMVEKTVLRMERAASRIMASSNIRLESRNVDGENVTLLSR